MRLERIDAPASEPVTLAEAKAHLRVDYSTEDSLIGDLIKTATRHLEGRHGILGRALVTQTWDYYLEAWPTDVAGRQKRRIEIPLPPLRSVTGVYYRDTSGVEQTLSAASYAVDKRALVGAIQLKGTAQWPALDDDPEAVRIRFAAGFGDAADVPEPVRQSIKLLVGHWFLSREAVGQVGTPVAMAVEALTAPYRSDWLA